MHRPPSTYYTESWVCLFLYFCWYHTPRSLLVFLAILFQRWSRAKCFRLMHGRGGGFFVLFRSVFLFFFALLFPPSRETLPSGYMCFWFFAVADLCLVTALYRNGSLLYWVSTVTDLCCIGSIPQRISAVSALYAVADLCLVWLSTVTDLCCNGSLL